MWLSSEVFREGLCEDHLSRATHLLCVRNPSHFGVRLGDHSAGEPNKESSGERLWTPLLQGSSGEVQSHRVSDKEKISAPFTHEKCRLDLDISFWSFLLSTQARGVPISQELD